MGRWISIKISCNFLLKNSFQDRESSLKGSGRPFLNKSYFSTNIIFKRLYRFLGDLICNAGADFEFIRLDVIHNGMIQRPAY